MKQKHGKFWEINPLEGAKRKGLYLGYGVPDPKGRYVYPLRTLERNNEREDYFESVRYFEKEDIND